MSQPASETGGVKPMSIADRFVSERERLHSMSKEERAFRKQWLKDQVLHPREPCEVPEMYAATHNPIRRAYKWPLNQLENALRGHFRCETAARIRYYTGRSIMIIAGAYLMTYYVMYNTNDWTRKSGMRVSRSRIAVLPGDPDFPCVSTMERADYADRGFSECGLKL
ncbi:unnamed protein product [Phyllotreta striolata]|uniref:NADH dehydrogenase [ubiquinone] 1 beta subcomplex subunit 6 n=1 Tax=Phyllotreta striolata TaxID=444603 RepID=A0A9P0DR01_PHYSR|nr:unnamed protein product [Phyllotreta striolata]